MKGDVLGKGHEYGEGGEGVEEEIDGLGGEAEEYEWVKEEGN